MNTDVVFYLLHTALQRKMRAHFINGRLRIEAERPEEILRLTRLLGWVDQEGPARSYYLKLRNSQATIITNPGHAYLFTHKY